MGLCKCRTVTNLFCFEHKKNVCEVCISETHKKCIIKSYLQWLQDSDFDSTCKLCTKPLQEDTIRLMCLDLFHTECLDNYCKMKPPNTTAAGHLCPTCNGRILPSPTASGLIVENLRNYFKDAEWARNVLPSIPIPVKEINQNQQPIHQKVPMFESPSHSSGIIPTFDSHTKVDIDPDDARYKTNRRSRSSIRFNNTSPTNSWWLSILYI